MAQKKKSRPGWLWMLSLILAAGLGVAGMLLYDIYERIYLPNIADIPIDERYLYIPTGASYEDVLIILKERQIVKKVASFEWVADKMNYPNHIYPGRYRLNEEMNNRQLIELLRSGKQDPIRFRLKKLNLKEELAGKMSTELEADSATLMTMLEDKVFLREEGFTPDNIMSIFIPNTYDIYWNTSTRQFFSRFKDEYNKFWTKQRLAKAEKLRMSPLEVVALASIVEEEIIFPDEAAVVAGVYLNRLRLPMKLQADPTLIFAHKDYSIRRVLNEHKEIESPYNTYLHAGLPPGPICIPNRSTVDAVLNADSHKYLYFVVRADGSGYHDFAATYEGHLQNVRRYREERRKRRNS